LVSGLIARFSDLPGRVEEEPAQYGVEETSHDKGGSTPEKENE
jgi:hypothetical protein